ncbi:hypothetical protein [Caulobacter sp. DWP3-1-3b2]|uniref:hypothetical protein n=1 Tax=Caulobacter sp. DWP3-1-3b2 TaxID=2804643 RepID=UPI003CF25EF7
MLRRYLHGPGADEPLVWCASGAATPPAASRRWLAADQQGSIIATTDSAAAVTTTTNTYDEYGIPARATAAASSSSARSGCPTSAPIITRPAPIRPRWGGFSKPTPSGIRMG